MTLPIDDFFVVAHEAGAENPSLPTWANRSANPLQFSEKSQAVQRVNLESVPGAYQLLNVLTPKECSQLIELSEQLGYLPDAAVSLPREVRHNDNLVWVTDLTTADIIWQRVASLASQQLGIFSGKQPLGINARFRFYRYQQNDYFAYHTDGAWPGSAVVENELIANHFPDRYSFMTFLILLNDDFDGGATRFLVSADSSTRNPRNAPERRAVDVRTPAGGVLCFPHGIHPLHCVHSSEPITAGSKYIIRTDMLFEL